MARGLQHFPKREKPPSVVENLLTKIMDRPQTVVSREEFAELMRVPEHLRQAAFDGYYSAAAGED